MNKSTPLAQLPNNNNMQNQTFMTEQQRQYISQAQNAISSSQMPQNTQISTDISNDDDIVVQDILNQINASTEPSSINTAGANTINSSAINAGNAEKQQQIMMQQIAAQQQHQQQLLAQQNAAQQAHAIRMAAQDYVSSGKISPYDNILPSSSFEFKDYLLLFTDDLKLASIVFISVILVHFIPLDKIIGKYFAIDRVPYHEILLRATMAAILIIIIKKVAKI